MYKKLITILWSTLLWISAISAEAHCPTSNKLEKVCLMLDQNIIFIYDENKEHNGPYTDLTQGTLESIMNDGVVLKFVRVARGVLRIESKKALKSVELIIVSKNGKSPMKKHLLLTNQ